MWQCAKDYGFSTGDLRAENAQATQLYLLSTEELAQLPTNNIPVERHYYNSEDQKQNIYFVLLLLYKQVFYC